MKKLFKYLLDFIYPPTCLLCNELITANAFLCSPCHELLINSMNPSSRRKKQDFHHLTEDIAFDEVITCWDYTLEIEKLVHRVKFQRGKKLGVFLGNVAGSFIKDYFRDREDSVMIPVPLHKTRQRERGYNQSRLICQGIAQQLPGEVCPGILIRKRNTSSQTRLTAEERQRNVEGAFGVKNRDSVGGKSVILVDDVVTTGATVNSCAVSLKNAGVERIVCVALARPLLR